MRKLLTFLFAALMSASMFALTPKEDDTWDEGTKTLTVNSNPGYQAYKYQDEIQHVIISSGVTSIGVDAFYYCSGLTSVTIGNSVTSIGNSAFYYCSGLTSVKCVRETPANLGNDVFDHTHANLKIYVPAGSVGTYRAAWSAYADKIKAIPPSWVKSGDDWDDATKTLTVNSDLPRDAYKDQTVIEHVIISSGVTSIEWAAFWKCTGLTSIEIPSSVTWIGTQAFAGCTGLTSIEIPSSVTWIGTQAFGDCTSLVSVTINAVSLEWYGLLTFQVTPATLKIYVPAGSVNTYKAGWPTYADKIKAIPAPAPWVRDGDTWVEATKTLTVNSNLPEEAYKGQTVIEHVIISSGVTSVGNSAFYGCTGLTGELVIPKSVTSIGDGAFAACIGLTSIVVASENSKYDSRGNCNAIIETSSNKLIVGCKNTIIPNSVTSIGVDAFKLCTGLTSVTIPEGVTSIGHGAFYNCFGLTSITIPNSVISIGVAAFELVPNIVYSGSATGSPWGARSVNGYVDGFLVYSDNTKTNLLACSSQATGTIEIPNSVTSIGDSAFYECSGLEKVTILADSLESYGSGAFEGTAEGLKIYVPAGSVNTYKDAWSAYAAKIVAIPAPGPAWVRDGDAWDDATKTLTVNSNLGGYAYNYKDQTVIEHVIINNGVTSIGDYTFAGCTGLTSVTIPEGVTSIGADAFKECSGLPSITIPNSVTSIGFEAFRYCSNLKTVTILAESLESYGTEAFNGTAEGLKIYVPAGSVDTYKARWAAYEDKIKAIPPAWVRDGDEWNDTTKTLTVNSNLGEDAYWGVSDIVNLIISNSVTSIGEIAFYGCTGLTSVTIPNSVTSIGAAAFYGCSGLTSPVYNDHVFAYMPTSYSGTYTIPDGIESIAGAAFYVCTGLTSITIPNSVTSIGEAAFAECSGLTSVTIPEGVTSIGVGAFYECSGMTSITIPSSVTNIGMGAFAGDTALTSVTCVRETPANLGNDVFYATHANLKIYVPAGSVETYKAGWAAYEDKIVAIPAPTPTAVENVQTNEVQATKFFRDGQILILRDGKTYTLTGQAVK